MNSFLLRILVLLPFCLFFQEYRSQCYSAPSYCTSFSSQVTGAYNYGFTNITIGSINNTTSPNASGNNIYQDYTSLSTTSTAGSTISGSFTYNNWGSVRVFVDWNNDGVFNTSGTELCFTSTTINPNTTTSFNITVPSGQAIGSYRVRVAGDYWGSTVTPCGPLVYPGEVEDYTILLPNATLDALASNVVTPSVLITSPVSNTMSFSIQNISSTTITSVNAGYTVNGGTAVTQSFTGLSIAAGASHALTFSTGLTTATLGNYQLRFFISSLNGGSSTPTPLNDTICKTSALVCTGPLSGSYTINAASALSSTNFPSFTLAASALANCGISGPVLFNVAAGTYTDTLTLTNMTGISPTNTVTFDGGAGNRATRILTSGGSNVVRFLGSRYITIRNMTIRSSAISNSAIVRFSNDSNDKVSNCNIEYTTNVTAVGANGIVVGEGNTAIINPTFLYRNIMIDSNTINFGYTGIYSRFNNQAGTVFIRDNQINNTYYAGINTDGNQILRIQRNRVNINASNTNNYYGGIRLQSNTTLSASFIDISNNQIYGANYFGILLNGVNATTGNRTLVSNNMIGNFGQNYYNGVHGIFLEGTNSHVNILHNTVNHSATPSLTNSQPSSCLYLQGTPSNIHVQNNLFTSMAPSGVSLFGVIAQLATSIASLNFNNYFSTSSDNLLMIAGNTINKSNYKTFSPVNGGVNSIFENPEYISSTNLRTMNSCMPGNSGLAITLDIDGQTRPSVPNLGADEVVGAPLNDLGVIDITSPNFPLNPGSNTVTVVLKNFGSNTITSANIHYVLNNGTAVTQVWTGSLAPCATTNFTFSTPVTVPAGSNQFRSFTSMPNASVDNLLGNDTTAWNQCTALNGSYTVGAGGNFATLTAAVNSLSCGGISGPVTLNVLPGIYDEKIIMYEVRGSSATNTIRIQPSNGLDSSVIFRPTSIYNEAIFRFRGTDFITIDRITFINTTTGYGVYGIEIGRNCQNLRITNCIVLHTNIGSYFKGVSHEGTVDQQFEMTGCRIYNGEIGIDFYSSSERVNKRINISNNTFVNQTRYGIQFGFGDSISINNNRIISDRIDVWHGIKVDGARSGGELKNNRIIFTNANSTSVRYGIMTHDFNSQSTGVRGLIANNFVSIAGSGNYRGFGIEGSTPHTDFYHNTSQMNSSNSSSSAFWLASSVSTSNYRNNIFQNTGTGLAIQTSGGSGVFSHNNYFSSGTNLANNSGTNYTALSTYQTATSQHANSLNKRIRFASASDLSTTSPCIGNAGMNLTSLVPLDINNVTRSITPDLGAVEFSNSAVEAGLLNIISPLTSATTGSTCTVTATVINNGSSPITSLNLNYVIGASNAAQSFTTSSGITAGGILPCDTLNLSFTTTFALASTHRRLRVFISSVNSVTDASQTNDTLIAKLCTTAAMTSISQSICHGASFFFKGANRTVAGIYIDTLATSVGCDSIITLTLTVLANTNYTSTPVFNSTGGGVDTIKVCSGSNVTLIGAGATTYAWSGPQTITNNTAFSAISSGLYTVTGTSGACINTKTVYVQIFALPTLSYTSIPAFSSTGGGVDTIKVCSGTNITLAGSGANTHIWSGPQSVSDNSVFTSLVTGRYTLTGTSINSCVNTRFVFVSLAHPALVISSSAGALISGSYVSAFAGGGGATPLLSASFSGPSAMCYDAAKNMYVADFYTSTIKKITLSGVVSNYLGIANTQGGTNGPIASATISWPLDVVTDASDNLYILEYAGNRLRKVTPSGTVSTLAGSGSGGSANGNGTSASFSSPTGMCIDPSGNIYIADRSNNRIRMVTPTGDVTTFAGNGNSSSIDGTSSSASFTGPNSICRDTSGNFYVSDEYGNKIRKISSTGIVTTIAGSGIAGSTDGLGTVATFNQPSGIKLDAFGNLYVAEIGGNKIRKITPTGIVTTLAGTGASGTTNSSLLSSTFTQPWGILLDSAANIIVADRGSNRIRKVNLGADTAIVCAGTSVTLTSTGAASYSWTGPQAVTNGVPFTVSTQGQYTVSGTGSNGCISEKNVYVKLFEVGYSSTPVYSSTGGGVDTIKVCIGNSVTLTGSGAASYIWSGPQTISNGTPFTVTTSGNYTVSGTSVSGCVSTKVIRIQLLTTPTLTLTTSPASIIGNPISTVTTFAGSGSSGSTDAAGITASFNVPASVAIDAGGNIYVADQNNHKIRKISPAGAVTTFAGSGTAGSTDASGTAASFRNPAGVAVDAGGHVYVADQYNHKIRKISPAGVVTTMAGSGTAGSTNATGTSASFNYPSGIAVDGSGNVYVGDYFNHRIRKISPAGVVTTLAGSGVVGSTDATGTSASFNRPNGVVVDGGGNVYVADQFNHRIRKISPAGVVTTIAGSGSAGSTDATGTAASFNSPSGIAIDGGDNIYVADFSNNRIRKISPTGVVTTLAGSGSSGSTDATGTAASFSNPCHLVLDGGGNIYIADYSNNKIRKIAISTNPDTVKVCTGGNAALTGTGAVSYAWSGPQAITNNVSFGVTASGRYTVTGTASSGCTSTKQVFVLLNTLPSVSYTSTPAFSSTGGGVDTIVGINGNSLLLSGSGANTYSWSGPQSITNGVSFVASSFGEYIVTGTGAGGCTNTKKVYVKLITIALNLASSSNNGIKFVRKANVGSFIYYGDASNYYFAIDTSGITSGSLTGDTLMISVQTTIDSFKSSNGANQEHAMFLMPRYWDAKGSFTGTVKVRFPYLPADTATLTTLRDSAWARLKRTNTNTLAVKTSKIEWFKTVSVPYTAVYISGIVGNKFPSTIVKPSVIYGVTAGGVHYVELGGITSFSGGGAGIGFGPGSGGGGVGLPVTWAGFDVKTLESGNELIWKTASEKNTDYFEVEYSYDAREYLVASDKILAAGNSADVRSYHFTHGDFSPFVYYRIKQVDLDGQFDYSAIKLAKRAKGKEFIVAVYPNLIPENGRITIEAKNIDQSQMNLSIIDVTGKFVYTNSYIPSANSLREVIDLINLQSGVYFIEISNGQGRETVKVVR